MAQDHPEVGSTEYEVWIGLLARGALREILKLADKYKAETVGQAGDFLHGRAKGAEACAEIAREALNPPVQTKKV